MVAPCVLCGEEDSSQGPPSRLRSAGGLVAVGFRVQGLKSLARPGGPQENRLRPHRHFFVFAFGLLRPRMAARFLVWDFWDMMWSGEAFYQKGGVGSNMLLGSFRGKRFWRSLTAHWPRQARMMGRRSSQLEFTTTNSGEEVPLISWLEKRCGAAKDRPETQPCTGRTLHPPRFPCFHTRHSAL